MLAKFRQRYPQGSLVSELINIDRGFYLVKVSILIEQVVLATGLAGASTIEAAEDNARERAIAALVLDASQPADIKITANDAPDTSNKANSIEPTAKVNLVETERQIASSPEPQPEVPLRPHVPEEKIASPVEETAATAIDLEPVSNLVDLKPETEPSPQPNLFSGTFATPTNAPLTEESSSVGTVDTARAIATPNLEEMDFNEIKQKTDIEIKRLGWTKDDGREFLKSRYGKRSRLHLTDEQLLEFLGYLEQQPTPVK